MEVKRRRVTRAVLIGLFCSIGYAWYHFVYCLPKVEYNKVHPYTSWIPITGEVAAAAGNGMHRYITAKV
jgi:hypothetical protein